MYVHLWKAAFWESWASCISRDMQVCMYQPYSATNTWTFCTISWCLSHVRLRSTEMLLCKYICETGGGNGKLSFDVHTARRVFFQKRVELLNLWQLPPASTSKVRTTSATVENPLKNSLQETWAHGQKRCGWTTPLVRMYLESDTFAVASFAGTDPSCPKSG